MNAVRCMTYELSGDGRRYGEVYECNGVYWAEIVLVDERIDWVTEKSPEFACCEQACAWLAEKRLAPGIRTDVRRSDSPCRAAPRGWRRWLAFLSERRKVSGSI